MDFLYKPKGIVLHCTATENKNYTLKSMFLEHVRRGYECIGYHYVIMINGTIWNTRPINYKGAHARGYNDYIGIAYVGGLKNGKPYNTLNDIQEECMGALIDAFTQIYNFDIKDIKLHNELANKACPCFNREDLNNMYLYKVNIKDPVNYIKNISKNNSYVYTAY